MEQARQEFRRLLDGATAADLRRAPDGTKWTNQQLPFHMLFGYLTVRALLPLTRLFGRLPGGSSGRRRAKRTAPGRLSSASSRICAMRTYGRVKPTTGDSPPLDTGSP